MRLISIDPYCLSVPPYGMIGPSVAQCPSSLLMIATLINGSDSGVCTAVYRSFDGGQSWRREADMEYSYAFDHRGSMIKVGDGSIFYDQIAHVLLYVGNDATWTENRFESTKRCYLPYFRLSFDDGHTWTPKRFIMLEDEAGARYSQKNPIRGVEYGRNMCLCCQSGIVRAGDGGLLAGIQIQKVEPSGRLLEPCGFHFFESGALKAKWDPGEETYRWSMGETMSVTPEQSTRGLFEPQFAAIEKRGALAIMRMSNQGARESIAGGKYIARSGDCGVTWSTPEKLTYDDGRAVCAASSIAKLLAHSGGKLYMVCALSFDAGEPDGNWPRHRLCAMELDADSMTVKADTVLDLTKSLREETPGERCMNDFTNHGVYENPVNGHIVVLAPHRSREKGTEAFLARIEIEP